MELAIVMSNVALVLVTLMMVAVDWHSDNVLVKIIRILKPPYHNGDDDS